MALPKRTPLSIETKMEVLEALLTKSKVDVAREFGIGYSTVKKIKKNEDEIMNKASANGNLLRKRCRRNPNEEVSEALITWYHQMKAQNMPINGPIMLEKAKELAANFGFDDFKPSHGWLERLKARHNIRFKPYQSRTASSKVETGDWVTDVLPKMIGRYDPNDIFNADETALFYKAAPSILTGNHPQSAATSKDRLTVLFLCNSTGTEKQTYVIGTLSNPACFDKEGTPLPYYSNENALMTHWIWCDILQKLDESLGKRKIILFVDKESCHQTKMQLKNIKLAFMPPTSPNVVQPLNQGIIRMIKIYYRAQLMKKMINVLNQGMLATDFTKTIDILQALRLLDSAWYSVSPSTIVDCFQKSGFGGDEVYCLDEFPDGSDEIFQLKELLQEDFDTFVECDKDIDCFENTTSSETVNTDQATQEIIAVDEPEKSAKKPRVSHREALKALSTLRRYLDENFTEYDAYYEVEEMVRLSAYANGIDDEMTLDE